MDCILDECEEEASLPRGYVREHVRPVGTVTLANQNPRTGLFHGEVLYAYDLELPAPTSAPASGEEEDASRETYTPTPNDGEVEAFTLMDCAEVRRRMERGEFKPNVCCVMIDFLVRHGVVTPEGEGEEAYVEVCARLRRRLPMATGPGRE